MSKFIIWTRSREDWPKDAPVLAKGGLPLLHLPCICTRPLPFEAPCASFVALLFTSIRAIQMSLDDPALSALVRAIPLVMTFGARCTAELRKRGLTPHRAKQAKSSLELTRYFVDKIAPTLAARAQVLAMGPARPAFDAGREISSLGLGYTYLPLYETLPRLELSGKDREHYRRSLEGIVCFASPSAVEGFAQSLMAGGEDQLGTRLVAVAIGETTARKCRAYFREVHLAATQDVAALVERAQALFVGIPST